MITMAHQEESAIRYTGEWDSVPSEERSALDSAFVDVMTTAQFNRYETSFDGTLYGEITHSPFSRQASGFLRNITPQPADPSEPTDD